jgi:polysaccharide pyruvyl transferase WcaK-like protein
MFWNNKANTETKIIYLFGWHGNNASGDDLLGHCAKNIYLKRAAKKGLKAKITNSGECDLAVIGGGTILGFDSMHLYSAVREIKAPLVIFGGGFRREKREIGHENRKTMEYLFGRASLAGVRGYISQQFFIHNDIAFPEVIGDLGLLFEPEPVKRPFEGEHKVGVFVRNMGKTGEPQYVDNKTVHNHIARVCDWLAEEFHSKFYFISFAENPCDSDMEGIQSTISMMRYKNAVEVIPYSPDFIQQCSLIGQMDYIVSQRLHPIVLAWLTKKPCIGIDYQFGKTSDFMGSIGMDEFVIRTDEFNLDVYKVKLKRLMDEKQLIIEHSQRSIQHWRNRLTDFVDKSLELLN